MTTPLPIKRISREIFDVLPIQESGMRPRFAGFKRRLKNRHDCDQWLVGRAVSVGDGLYGIIWGRIEVVS
jgi:hypothetical protein